MIAAGVVPRLVQFLHCHDDPTLAFEAAWALTNVASGTSEHARVIIDNGAIPVLVSLMVHPDTVVREQSLWALGNLAGDSPRCRDLVLSYGLIAPLIAQCEAFVLESAQEAAAAEAVAAPSPFGRVAGSSQSHAPHPTFPAMQRNATWLLSNMCRGKPPPRWALIAPALPVLVQLLQVRTDDDVLTDACWALSYLSEPPERVAPVVEAGAVNPLIRLLNHSQPAVQTPALRTVGNIAAGTAAEAGAVVRCGVLDCLGELLRSPKKEIRKETAWMVSNLTAGDQAQVGALSAATATPFPAPIRPAPTQVAAVCGAGLIPRLLEMVASEEFEVRKEVAYALCNACCSGSAEVVRWLAQVCGAGVGASGPICMSPPGAEDRL